MRTLMDWLMPCLITLALLLPGAALGQQIDKETAPVTPGPASGAKTPSAPAGKPEVLPSGVTLQKDIEYAAGGGNSRSLDLYLPRSTEQPVPLVMFIHGGGWHSGSKDGCPAKFLAEHGYAVASINYRFSQDAVFPAQIEDCRAALRFLRSQAAKYHLQSDHVGVWGGSAGAHLAALLGTAAAADFSGDPAKATAEGKVDEGIRVQCVVDMYGPVDFTHLMGSSPQKKDTSAIKLLGPCANEAELMTKAKWASPVTYVRRDNPPFLVQHGDADKTVPLEQGREIADVLQKAGVEVSLTVMPGAGHAGAAFFTEENHKALVAFFDKYLKPARRATTTKAEAPAVVPGEAAMLTLADLGPADPTTAPTVATSQPDPLSPNVTLQKDIEYVPGGGKSRTLDLYLPPSDRPVPLLIFIHGGGWRGGSKDGCPAKFLANYGFAVASINYRVAREAVFPAQIEDCRAALKFLRAQAAKYHIQPDHVGVWGGSAGAHLAALLGTSAAIDFSAGPDKATPDGKFDEAVRVQCVIDMYGPSDLTPVVGRNPDRNDVWKAAAALLGPCADDKELMKKAKWASPVTYVRRDSPPFLVQHGDADVVVPLEQGRKMAEALQKAGADATLMVMPGAGHAGAPLFTEENHQALVAFLNKHLKPASGSAPPK